MNEKNVFWMVGQEEKVKKDVGCEFASLKASIKHDKWERSKQAGK